VFLLDMQGNIIAVDEQGRQGHPIVGSGAYAAVDAGPVGMNYLELCDRAVGRDRAIAAAFAAGMRDVIAGARVSFEVEYPCHTPTELYFFVARVTRMRMGDRDGLIVAHHDVTTRKRAEQSLREAETLWRLALQGGGLGVWDWRVQSEALVVSAGLKAMLGFAPEELADAAREIPARVHPDDREQVLVAARAHLLGQSDGYTCVYRMQHKDGSWRWFLSRGAVVERDGEGRPVRMVGTTSDISERRESQLELERATALLEASQALAHVGGWEIDIATRGLYWTAETYRIHDLDPSGSPPVLGGGIESYAPESAPILRAAMRSALSDGTPFDLELELVTVKGRRVWVRAAGAPVFKNGKLVKLSGTVQDVTESRKLKLALVQARDEALEAARTKSEFLSTMSHEIRTPMNGVIGFAELLLGTRLTAQQLDMAQMIKSSGESLLVLLNDILDFSKMEAGKLRLELMDFSMADCVEQPLRLLAPKANGKALHVEHHIDPLTLGTWRGDALRIQQVLVNLVGNAIKFTEAGSVDVRVDLVTPATGGTDARMRFTVRDTGVGIAPEVLPQLFQAFMQADGSITRKYGGTGLGLAISRQIVELMGGTIGCTSEVGQGASFWFELPLQRGVQRVRADPADNTSDLPQAAALHLLVVDDAVTNQLVARMLLQRMGHSVDVANNGHEALLRLQSHQYDAVFLDCQMPLLDGYETARQIRSGLHAGIDPTVVIIALTAHAMASDRELCLACGMNDYVTKPVRSADLRAVLKRCGLEGGGAIAGR
jgi:PAS domain S-box-containing protein